MNERKKKRIKENHFQREKPIVRIGEAKHKFDVNKENGVTSSKAAYYLEHSVLHKTGILLVNKNRHWHCMGTIAAVSSPDNSKRKKPNVPDKRNSKWFCLICKHEEAQTQR